MNFKRNWLFISLSLLACVSVTSCASNKTFSKYVPIEELEDNPVNEVSYTKIEEYAPYVAKNASNEDVSLGSSADVLRKYAGISTLNTVGDAKLLVIPVDFPDFRVAQLGVSSKDYIENLKKAFFGISKNNLFVSVSEFYNKSSYGKLRLDGNVVNDFYSFPLSIDEINRGVDQSAIANYYGNIISWCESKNINLDEYKIDPSKEAKDNNVAIYLVYTYPIEMVNLNKDFFWSFTFENVPLSWGSYSFLYTQNGLPDSHYLLHEVGHLFGLTDYYPSEQTNKDVSCPEPTGRIDMMDNMIGDHTAFSKMMLNWVKPYQIHNTCDITLHPLENKPEVILINDSWNQSVFDEYYLLEFYIPNSLNYHDSNVGSSSAKLPSVPGLKLYHVDARLAYFNRASGNQERSFINYATESGTSPNGSNIYFAHNNNTYPNSTEQYKKNFLYELVLNNALGPASECAKNNNLYRVGDVIKDLSFHQDNLSFNYEISINSLTFNDIKLHFEKK